MASPVIPPSWFHLMNFRTVHRLALLPPFSVFYKKLLTFWANIISWVRSSSPLLQMCLLHPRPPVRCISCRPWLWSFCDDIGWHQISEAENSWPQLPFWWLSNLLTSYILRTIFHFWTHFLTHHLKTIFFDAVLPIILWHRSYNIRESTDLHFTRESSHSSLKLVWCSCSPVCALPGTVFQLCHIPWAALFCVLFHAPSFCFWCPFLNALDTLPWCFLTCSQEMAFPELSR